MTSLQDDELAKSTPLPTLPPFDAYEGSIGHCSGPGGCGGGQVWPLWRLTLCRLTDGTIRHRCTTHLAGTPFPRPVAEPGYTPGPAMPYLSSLPGRRRQPRKHDQSYQAPWHGVRPENYYASPDYQRTQRESTSESTSEHTPAASDHIPDPLPTAGKPLAARRMVQAELDRQRIAEMVDQLEQLQRGPQARRTRTFIGDFFGGLLRKRTR